MNVQYDGLNRPTSKTYGGVTTPAVTYCYDGQTLNPSQQTCTGAAATGSVKGRLTGVGTSASTKNYPSITKRGWIGSSQQTTTNPTTGNQTTYPPQSYTYFLNGALASVTYPSGRQVSYTLDSAGRVNSVGGSFGGQPTSYAPSILYTPFDAIQSASFSGSSGLLETWTYNSRMQPIGMTRSIGATPLLTLGTSYCTGTATDCAKNNGNLQSESITRAGTSTPWVLSFSYDSLNRLLTIGETVSGVQETYTYDAYGNRSVASSTFPTSALIPPAFDPATNRNSGGGWSPTSSYDTVGNVILDPLGGAYTYDAENRMVSSGTTTYTYDGEGRRVTQTASGTVTTYVYDAAGELAVEYGAPNVSGTQYLAADHLGSTRLVTDGSGNLPANGGCHDYMPFGVELQGTVRGSCFGGADAVVHKFTGKERDAETGLDFFGERYFSSAQGRFTSPDAMLAKKEWLVDPQRWNRYAYVSNNPLRYVDPNGEDLTIVYSFGPDASDEQKKWFNANKGKIFAAMQKKFNDAGVKNVSFKSADSLSKEDLQKLASSPVGSDNRTTGVAGVARLEITGQDSSLHPTSDAPLGVYGTTYHGLSNVFMDRLDYASSSACDAICSFANVAAHEIGHGLGFDDPGHTDAPFGTGFFNGISIPEALRRGAPDIMMQGHDPAAQPYNFNMNKDKNLKAVQEVNRVGGYPR